MVYKRYRNLDISLHKINERYKSKKKGIYERYPRRKQGVQVTL